MCEHRRLTSSFQYAINVTGADRSRASSNLHTAKELTGRDGADNVQFCMDCGAIIAPETGEVLGNLLD